MALCLDGLFNELYHVVVDNYVVFTKHGRNNYINFNIARIKEDKHLCVSSVNL